RHVGDGDPFVCGIVEAHVGEGAELDYAVVQQAGEAARIMFSRGARCERDAQVRWHLAELGGALVRSVLDARLDHPGARAEASALFFNTGMQHVDLTSGVDHTVGPTTSDTVVRSAATDRGQGRYAGNIVIRPKAHGSDASLRDDALLLSKRAHIDSIPALEIAANDVKAFHGATVGSLDEDALFYAGSRGIARAEALRLITLGFFEPVIARFPGEALRDEIRTALDRKIDDATEIGV
ncbi:MAG TPA: SufD family Fe-S cluster assembly protein, partial [Candidatus Elarobacter sp.]